MELRPMINQAAAPRVAECLIVYRLPGRLDVRQTASLLGFQPHDIPVLVASKLLQPLGKPVPNAPKYFAACVVEELRCEPDWLDRATRTLSRHWQVKNGRKCREDAGEPGGESGSVTLAG